MRRFLALYPFGAKPIVRLLLLVALASVSACSSTQFLYNRIDTLIAWYVDDYVTLSREQDKVLRQQLDAFHDWHRQQELPFYIDLLDLVDNKLDSRLEETDVDELASAFQVAADRLRTAALDFAMDLGEDLSQTQRIEFVASMREQQEIWYEERLTLSDDAYYKALQKRFEKNLSDLMGRLEDEQKAAISQHIREFTPMHHLWYEQRSSWTMELQQVLEEQANTWQEPTMTVIESWESRQTEAYLLAYAHNLERTKRAIRDVLNARSAKQDRRLRRSLNGYLDDFAQLAFAP